MPRRCEPSLLNLFGISFLPFLFLGIIPAVFYPNTKAARVTYYVLLAPPALICVALALLVIFFLLQGIGKALERIFEWAGDSLSLKGTLSIFVAVAEITLFVAPPLGFFWKFWTIQRRLLGYKPPNRCRQTDASSETTDASSSPYTPDTTITTSTLCTECYQIITQSGLIAGSRFFFTKRNEWHRWTAAYTGIQLEGLQAACHLCNLLWYSIPEDSRKALVDNVPHKESTQILGLILSSCILEYGKRPEVVGIDISRDTFKSVARMMTYASVSR